MTASSSCMAPVDDLSDDDCSAAANTLTRPAALGSRPERIPKRMLAVRRCKIKFKNKLTDVRTLRYRVDISCGCLCQCFLPFKDSATFGKLMQLHKTMESMDKLEQDKHVISLSYFLEKSEYQNISKKTFCQPKRFACYMLD